MLQELAVDALGTTAILWVLVLLGEPLAAIIVPLVIVLMAGSLACIAWYAYRRDRRARASDTTLAQQY